MSKIANTYTGRAGQLAVMAEFLMRGWNVAIPEVDVGDDIFVVQDNQGILRRVQVKTAIAHGNKQGYSAKFHIPVAQITRINRIPLYFAFVIRNNDLWSDILIVPVIDLLNDYFTLGTNKSLSLFISFVDGKVTCKGQDFSIYCRNFNDFPLVF